MRTQNENSASPKKAKDTSKNCMETKTDTENAHGMDNSKERIKGKKNTQHMPSAVLLINRLYFEGRTSVQEGNKSVISIKYAFQLNHTNI